MRKAPVKMLAVAAAVLLAGCAGHRPGPEGGPGGRHEEEWHAPVQILLRFDANHDDSVTRGEMEAGLKAEFAAADTNHDGVLELDEVRAVNDKRWSEDASASSPLVDWNHDGVVDFDEFAATARSLFAQMDVDGNGVLSPKELRPQGNGPGQGEKGGEQRGHGGRGGGHGGGGRGGQGGGGDDGDGQ
jgi:uncharacterized membrane protein YgcG